MSANKTTAILVNGFKAMLLLRRKIHLFRLTNGQGRGERLGRTLGEGLQPAQCDR